MWGVRSRGLAMTAVLLVAACGSGDEAGGSSSETALVSSVPLEGGPGAADPEVAAFLAGDDVAEADRLATVAVEVFGSPEAATDAVLFALDAGYAGRQIEVALLAGTLQVTGSVNGVQPAFPPTDLVIGFRSSPPEPLPVERLRQAATEEAVQLGLVDPGGVSGRNGLQLVLVLVTKGIPPEAIVEALILGFEWPHELDEPLDFECALDAVSESAIIVAGVVYPALGCGEPYPLSGADEPSTDAPSDAVLVEADSPSAVESTDGAWTGNGTTSSETESRSTTWTGSAAVELRDGVFTLSFEKDSQSTELGPSSCWTTTSAFGQIDATPDDFGRVVFTADVSTDIVSDCPFYDSTGGRATETNGASFVGHLRDDNVFELENLVPGQTIELVWIPI